MTSDRYKVEHKREADAVGVIVDMYYIKDTLPRTGKYSTYVGRIYDEKLANMAVEVFNDLRKPRRRRNLQQTRNR